MPESKQLEQVHELQDMYNLRLVVVSDSVSIVLKILLLHNLHKPGFIYSMNMSEAITFTLPPQIAKELDVITELGIYRDKDSFILDAINTLLSSHIELRISIACRLYENEDVSLGKAAEIVGTSIEEMKNILSEHGIKLKIGTSIPKTRDRTHAVLGMIRGN